MDILLNHKDVVPETPSGSGKCTITGRGTALVEIPQAPGYIWVKWIR